MVRAARARQRGPGRPTNPISDDELLQRAREVFALHGFGAASTDDIAKHAGLRKASLFYHFPSKEALYRACLERTLLELVAIVSQAWLESGPFARRLDALVRAVTRYLGHHPGAARLILRELMDNGPAARELQSGPLASLFDHLVDFLGSADAPTRGAGRAETRQLAVSMLCMNVAYFAADATASALVGGDVYDPARVRERENELVAQTRRLCGVPPPSKEDRG